MCRSSAAESELVETILKNGVTRIVLAFSRSTHEDVLQVVRNAGLRDVHISIVPRYFEIIAANVGIVDVEGISVLELPVAGLSRLARTTKRAFDLALTVPALILLSPLSCSSRSRSRSTVAGPVLFQQARMGREDEAFEILKFRTMVLGAEQMRDGAARRQRIRRPPVQDPRRSAGDARRTHAAAFLDRRAAAALQRRRGAR